MKLAIMQPYLFPYIGYFQLVAAVDRFVVYDDVNFIKQGWINRNAILATGKRLLFTVPLSRTSSFSLINETMINDHLYARWWRKLRESIVQNYARAPYFDAAYEVVARVFETQERSIGRLAAASVAAVASYLGLRTTFVASSTIYGNAALKGFERILDICRREHANFYYNPSGGAALYSKQRFAEHGIELRFFHTKDIRYRQFGTNFVPALSIIDVLMFNPKEAIHRLLGEYRLA